MSSNPPQNITVDPADPRQALALLDRLVGDLSFNRASHDIIRQAVATLNGTIQTGEATGDSYHNMQALAIACMRRLRMACEAALTSLGPNAYASGELVASFNLTLASLRVTEVNELKLDSPKANVDPMPKETTPAHSESDITGTGGGGIESTGQALSTMAESTGPLIGTQRDASLDVSGSQGAG